MKIYDVKETCKKVFDLAQERGWSDSKLASILDVTPQAVGKWRREVGSPSIETLVRLSGIFQVSLDDVIGYEEKDIAFYDLGWHWTL